MRARDFVKRNVAYHSELNPVAWRGNQLRPEVRKHLLKIAEIFEHYLEIPNFTVQDIVLTGSMANYNYTRYSDFDLHIVADYTDLQCDDFAEAFYQAKKKIWNDAHDITIRGHEVELYVEDIKRTAVSGGVYSIQENDWIKEPDYDPPVIDNTAVNLKVLDLVKRINSTIKERDHLSMKSLMDKLRKMRRSGLDTEGEFGVENLAFKILRNQGYIDRLQHAEIDQQDAELSLKENKQELNEAHIDPDIAKILKKKGYRLLGQGGDVMAFLEPSTGLVLKIFGTDTDTKGFTRAHQGFFDWVKYCMAHSANPFLPQFSGYESFEFKGQTYLQIRQERLYDKNPDLTDYVAMMVDFINGSLEDFISSPPPEIVKKIGIKNMPLLYNTFKEIVALTSKHGYAWDLNGNVMTRANGFPVIVDPWVAEDWRD